jgi:hypothetical protein
MLEKLLPSLFKKEKNPEENQPNQKRSNSADISLESDFNLVSSSQRLYVVPKYVSNLTLVIRNFIVLLSVSFGVMLVLNFIAVNIINYQKNIQEDSMEEIELFGDVEEKVKSIDAKTFAYKKFSNEREELLPKVEFVFDNIGEDIEIKTVDISPFSFSISFSGKTALDFTNLIVRYLEKDILSEIVIRSASLDKSKNLFNVVLDGSFK